MRRVLVVSGIGAVACVVMLPVVGLELAVLAGWDVAAALFLGASWFVIIRADGPQTQRLATVVDETRQSAAMLVLGACLASLLAVGITLRVAGDQQGAEKLVSIVGVMLTVVLSWSTVNTMFTLRYADHYYRSDQAVDFGGQRPGDRPDYLDFAYLAFTIGMCYQVSDTTLRDRHIRRVVLVHSLVAYVFGIVIISTGINLIADLLD